MRKLSIHEVINIRSAMAQRGCTKVIYIDRTIPLAEYVHAAVSYNQFLDIARVLYSLTGMSASDIAQGKLGISRMWRAQIKRSI